MKRSFDVKITAHPTKKDRYVAHYASEFLGARFSVEFENTITGAVALYHFVDMLKSRYPEGEVSFQLPDHARVHPVPAVRDAWSMQRS